MWIHNQDDKPYNLTELTKPLFDAMEAGNKIKSVTCMDGLTNKDKPELDITFTNVTAWEYWVGDAESKKRVPGDLVEIMADDIGRSKFHMNLVRSFELA